jgi:tRNA dimethylallyltransferase
VGPTASGKSEFAERLAAEHGGEVLNADSQQFYRGMDVGTGKIDPARAKVRHWLLDICEPGEAMTGMEFARRADEIIGKLHQEGKVSVVVGGTGLYVRCLFEGLDDLPERNDGIRERLNKELADGGGAVLHHRLKEIDPQLAARIHPNDPARLVRFLEIWELTGKPPSRILSGRRPERLRYPARTFWLSPPRDRLREKIAERVKNMIRSGWLEEVRGLMARGLDPRFLSNKPIGYADLAEVAAGNLKLEAAEEKIVFKTRQYAKRQETFFRGLLSHPAYFSFPCELSRFQDAGEEFADGVSRFSNRS